VVAWQTKVGRTTLEDYTHSCEMIEDSVDGVYFGVESKKHDGLHAMCVWMHCNIMYFSEIV
jgi:hypothetical protein